MLFLTHLPLSLFLSTLPSSTLPYSTLMLSWFSFKVNNTIFGVRSVVELVLAMVINVFIPNPMFYVHRSVHRQPFFEMDKTKKNLGGLVVRNMHTHNIFSSSGWHSLNNLSKLNHFTIRGFNAAGNLVFMVELANRVVDSEAWVYRLPESLQNILLIYEKNRLGYMICLSLAHGACDLNNRMFVILISTSLALLIITLV
ncbi:hypothetical protein F5146DRAFT_995079 [Armillaria mellea]|nr:hypothetical protein F5146DRAFT_995079 [Armillaria mellea]